jgi:DNA-binding transcriptional MerR regulator
MRSAGVAVEALVEYISLFKNGESSRQARKDILKKQRELLAVRITEMQEALDKLNFKVENYDSLVFEAERKINR